MATVPAMTASCASMPASLGNTKQRVKRKLNCLCAIRHAGAGDPGAAPGHTAAAAGAGAQCVGEGEMKRMLTVGLLAALLTSSGAIAQGKKGAPVEAPRVWTQEPETVLGVKLGRPLEASALPACPEQMLSATGVCLRTTPPYFPGDHPRYSLGGHGIPHVAVNVYLDEAGAVHRITFWTQQIYFADVLGILVSRYGAPSTQDAFDVKTRAGASFASSRSFWQGKRLSILAEERFDKIDESLISFSDNAATEREAAKRAEKNRSAAAKL